MKKIIFSEGKERPDCCKELAMMSEPTSISQILCLPYRWDHNGLSLGTQNNNLEDYLPV